MQPLALTPSFSPFVTLVLTDGVYTYIYQYKATPTDAHGPDNAAIPLARAAGRPPYRVRVKPLRRREAPRSHFLENPLRRMPRCRRR